MVDIDALIVEAREVVQSSRNGGVLGTSEWPISEELVERMADALERQQIVVEVARMIGPELQAMYDGQDSERKRTGSVGSYHRDRFESWVDNLDEEIATLDLPPEGDG